VRRGRTLRFEAHALVRTIAEGLRAGSAAAAEVNPLTFWPRVLVALGVDYRCRPVQAVRAVSPDNDSDFFAWHGLQLLVIAFQVDGSTDNASRSRRGRCAPGRVRLNGILETVGGVKHHRDAVHHEKMNLMTSSAE
jgi:hypothetical protein